MTRCLRTGERVATLEQFDQLTFPLVCSGTQLLEQCQGNEANGLIPILDRTKKNHEAPSIVLLNGELSGDDDGGRSDRPDRIAEGPLHDGQER